MYCMFPIMCPCLSTVIDLSMHCFCLLCSISCLFHSKPNCKMDLKALFQFYLKYQESAIFQSNQALQQLISQFNTSSTTQKELIREKS